MVVVDCVSAFLMVLLVWFCSAGHEECQLYQTHCAGLSTQNSRLHCNALHTHTHTHTHTIHTHYTHILTIHAHTYTHKHTFTPQTSTQNTHPTASKTLGH